MGRATVILEVFGLEAGFVACDAGCKAADVTVESVENQGTTVTIRIPKEDVSQ